MTIAGGAGGSLPDSVARGVSDSTHGTMEAFELITARVRDGDGAEGPGYTYTVGAGGGAIHDLIARDLGPALVGADETRIEALWQRLWWRVHHAGRGAGGARHLGDRHRALGLIAGWEPPALAPARRPGRPPRHLPTPAGSICSSRSRRCCARPRTTSSRPGARSR